MHVACLARRTALQQQDRPSRADRTAERSRAQEREHTLPSTGPYSL